ncbi:hypothetical protein XaplCFBP3123_00570 [Xanthomonas arboricola pv. populi]|nr:hypothetical protein XaplCFBP3123_00570 [Xanthomonas arboricola pv. populi]
MRENTVAAVALGFLDEVDQPLMRWFTKAWFAWSRSVVPRCTDQLTRLIAASARALLALARAHHGEVTLRHIETLHYIDVLTTSAQSAGDIS